MKISSILLGLCLAVSLFSCKKTKQVELVKDNESVYTAKGKVNDSDVSFTGGYNNYVSFVNTDSSQNYMTYTFSLRTPNSSIDDYFEIKAKHVFAGVDSNDVAEMFDIVSPKTYNMGTFANNVYYDFAYYKKGVKYSIVDNTQNIQILSNKDMGDFTATDSKTGKTYTNRYVQFAAKLENVNLFNEDDEKLVISNLEFVGKFAALGDMKRKK